VRRPFYRWRNNESNAQKSGAGTSEEASNAKFFIRNGRSRDYKPTHKKTRKHVQRNATGSPGCREGGFFPFCSNSAGRRNW
jgi:hypothetical protein